MPRPFGVNSKAVLRVPVRFGPGPYQGRPRNYFYIKRNNLTLCVPEFISFKVFSRKSARKFRTFHISQKLKAKHLRNYSSIKALNPWWVTGFIDGEGCFHISIFPRKSSKVGWQVKLVFTITLNGKDYVLLEEIRNFFGQVGTINFKEKTMESSVQWRVESVKDLIKIVDHFCKYPLITEKYSDWKLFKKAFNLVQRSEHLTYEGLREIVAIKAAMNRGLSPKLKSAFADVVRQRGENRPKVIKEIPDPQWLAGFTSAEGCVKVNIQKSPKAKLGETVNLIFQLTQHMRDEELMKILINYLNCGWVKKIRTWFDFRVAKFQDITEKIIPFFKKYPIRGVKAQNFADWCKVAEMMKDKKHLTSEGLQQIKKIKVKMNTGR